MEMKSVLKRKKEKKKKNDHFDTFWPFGVAVKWP